MTKTTYLVFWDNWEWKEYQSEEAAMAEAQRLADKFGVDPDIAVTKKVLTVLKRWPGEKTA